MKIKTINVVQLEGGCLQSIISFVDNQEGERQAIKLFKEIAFENGARKKDLDELSGEGRYESDDYELVLVYSDT